MTGAGVGIGAGATAPAPGGGAPALPSVTVTVGSVNATIYGFAVTALAGKVVGAVSGTLDGLTIDGILATDSTFDTFNIYLAGDVRAAVAGRTIEGAGLAWDGSLAQFSGGRTVCGLQILDPAQLWTALNVGQTFVFTIE